MSENKDQVKKIDEIIEKLENLKQEIVELQQQMEVQKYENDTKNLFKIIRKITNEEFNSLFYVENGNVKYIAREQKISGFPNLIVYNDKSSCKIYCYRFYVVENYLIKVKYYAEYDIPDDVINILKRLSETPKIDEYATDSIFKLYCLLKQGYIISFIKEN